MVVVPLLSEEEKRIAHRYRHRQNRFAEQAGVLLRWQTRLWFARVLLLTLAVLGFVSAAFVSAHGGVFVVSSLGMVFGWAVCNSLAERVQARLRFAECLRDINSESIARMKRDWSRIPLTLPEVPEEWRGVADDLDLFGRASLYHLVSHAHTPWGRNTLRDWLLQPVSDRLAERQKAVLAMTGEIELRQELSARARLVTCKAAGPSQLVEWAEKGIAGPFK